MEPKSGLLTEGSLSLQKDKPWGQWVLLADQAPCLLLTLCGGDVGPHSGSFGGT